MLLNIVVSSGLLSRPCLYIRLFLLPSLPSFVSKWLLSCLKSIIGRPRRTWLTDFKPSSLSLSDGTMRSGPTSITSYCDAWSDTFIFMSGYFLKFTKSFCRFSGKWKIFEPYPIALLCCRQSVACRFIMVLARRLNYWNWEWSGADFFPILLLCYEQNSFQNSIDFLACPGPRSILPVRSWVG